MELQDAGGKPIPGFSMEESIPLCVDQVDAPVAWKSAREIPCPDGEPMRVRMALERARLFSWTFAGNKEKQ